MLDVGGWEPDPLRAKPFDDNTAALALHARGRTTEAIALLKAASEKSDADVALHSALARIYELAGDDAAAKQQASRALTLDSLDTRALELARRLGIKPVR
jgi:Flp pilus assembly protein TadD